jgi:hypothetical protein
MERVDGMPVAEIMRLDRFAMFSAIMVCMVMVEGSAVPHRPAYCRTGTLQHLL